MLQELKGDSERAKKISSEKDAFDLFSDDEMKMIWQMRRRNNWHIVPNPGCLSDYQCLAIYYSVSTQFSISLFFSSLSVPLIHNSRLSLSNIL